MAALDAAALGGPVYEMLHLLAVFPEEMKKLAGRQVRRFFSQKGLEAPTQVGTFPRLQAIALGRGPVVAQRFKHFLADPYAIAIFSALQPPFYDSQLEYLGSSQVVHLVVKMPLPFHPP